MFAHCLLPALLLIAAVDYSTGQRLPPVVTKAFEGNSSLPLTHHERFQIPENQCYGVLDVYEQSALRCVPPGVMGVDIAAILVIVNDVDHVNITIFKRGPNYGKVFIKRNPYKCKTKALVRVQTGCDIVGPNHIKPHII